MSDDKIITADFGARRRLPAVAGGAGRDGSGASARDDDRRTRSGAGAGYGDRPLTGAEAWGGLRGPGAGAAGAAGGAPDPSGIIAAARNRAARAGGAGTRGTRGRDDRLRTWGARMIVDDLSRDATGGRESRGIAYQREGRVIGMDVADGTVVAQVAGSQLEPFTVVLQLPPRRGGRRDALVDQLLEAPEGTLGSLASPDAPPFAGELVIGPDERIRATCDCPDAAMPCKHIVAVAHELGRRIDCDPEELLRVRGITQEDLQDRLARRGADAALRAARPVQPVPEDGEVPVVDFWGASLAPPPLPEVAAEPALRDTDAGLLHDALDVVSHGPADELRGFSQLEELYERLMADGRPPDEGADGGNDADHDGNDEMNHSDDGGDR